MIDPDVEVAVRECSEHVQSLHAELYNFYPTLRGTLAIPGVFVGHGLGSFVANGLSDDQVIAQVLAMLSRIRHALRDHKAPDPVTS